MRQVHRSSPTTAHTPLVPPQDAEPRSGEPQDAKEWVYELANQMNVTGKGPALGIYSRGRTSWWPEAKRNATYSRFIRCV
jgi:hypothetical protein